MRLQHLIAAPLITLENTSFQTLEFIDFAPFCLQQLTKGILAGFSNTAVTGVTRSLNFLRTGDSSTLGGIRIREMGVIRPDERKAFVNTGRLVGSNLPEACLWPSSGCRLFGSTLLKSASAGSPEVRPVSTVPRWYGYVGEAQSCCGVSHPGGSRTLGNALTPELVTRDQFENITALYNPNHRTYRCNNVLRAMARLL